MIHETKFNQHSSWIVLHSDQMDPKSELYATYNLDDEIIAYALDRNERAHVEYDHETDSCLLIFNALNPIKDDNHYETIPITFIAQKNRLITIVNKENDYILPILSNYLAKHPNSSIFTFLFASLVLISAYYFPYMEEIDREKDRLNRLLRQKTSKKDLLALSDLETGIVYLVSASNQNVLLLQQLKTYDFYKKLDPVEKENWEDALIEAQQLTSMTQLTAQILQQLSSTHNNVLNNNLNDNLVTLSIISILPGVVDMLTGFFGMNIPLPLTQEKRAWIYVLCTAALLWIIIIRALQGLFNKK